MFGEEEEEGEGEGGRGGVHVQEVGVCMGFQRGAG